MIKQDRGQGFSITATSGTTAIATQAGTTVQEIFVTDISGSVSTGTGTIVVKNGSSVIWQGLLTTAPFTCSFSEPLALTGGGSLSVTVTGLASSAVNANASGFITNLT